MTQIFISYSRADEKFARDLKRDLEKLGGQVWIDVDDILPGERWGQAIRRGLDQCTVMLVLLSPESMDSRHVEDEWTYFRDQNKPLLPLLLEPTPVIFGLHNYQYIDFHTQKYDMAFRQLHAALYRYKVAFTVPPDAEDVQIPAQPRLQPIVGERVGPALTKPPLLQSKTSYVRAELMIEKVQHTLWISGISLNRVTEHTRQFSAFLRRGGQLRAMLIDPRDDAVVRETSAYVDLDEETMRRRLIVSIGNVERLLKAYPDRVEIRTTHHRPSLGYFISDPDSPEGVMTAAAYAYQIDQVARREDDDLWCEPPFLHLTRQTEPQWFEVYRRDFERQWRNADVWMPHA